jgi:NAD(P)H dehydrogenase (quinone)
MRVIATGASGKLGRLVAESLMGRIAPSELVLVTRHPEALRELGARGADVRYGDFDDPASLPIAFAGDAAYCSSVPIRSRRSTTRRKVRRIA